MSDAYAEDDITLPVDTKRSRLTVKNHDTPPVSGFDPDDVATVDDRVAAFREQWPDGRIVTEVDAHFHHPDTGEPPTYVVVARAYRDSFADVVVSTGSSARTHGVGELPYSDFPLETAESVAISRALRFLSVKPTPPQENPDDSSD